MVGPTADSSGAADRDPPLPVCCGWGDGSSKGSEYPMGSIDARIVLVVAFVAVTVLLVRHRPEWAAPVVTACAVGALLVALLMPIGQ